MININKSNFVGKGGHREVYRHPENNNLCIKIVVDGSGNSRQERREKTYYRHLEKRGIIWDMIPKYYGETMTDLGTGSVFDLISDQDGAVSRTLEYYISTNEITERHYNSLEKSFYLLKDYLLKQRIITETLSPWNIVCQRNESEIIRFSVIDNIGNLDLIPFCNYVNYLAELKIHRRWKRFEREMLEVHPHNEALQRMLTS